MVWHILQQRQKRIKTSVSRLFTNRIYGLGWLIAVDRDIVYFLNKDTKEVYTVARGGSYFIRKCMNCFLEYPDEWARFDVEDTPGIYDYPTAVQERTAYIEAMSDELAMYMLRSKT